MTEVSHWHWSSLNLIACRFGTNHCDWSISQKKSNYSCRIYLSRRTQKPFYVYGEAEGKGEKRKNNTNMCVCGNFINPINFENIHHKQIHSNRLKLFAMRCSTENRSLFFDVISWMEIVSVFIFRYPPPPPFIHHSLHSLSVFFLSDLFNSLSLILSFSLSGIVWKSEK